MRRLNCPGAPIEFVKISRPERLGTRNDALVARCTMRYAFEKEWHKFANQQHGIRKTSQLTAATQSPSWNGGRKFVPVTLRLTGTA